MKIKITKPEEKKIIKEKPEIKQINEIKEETGIKEVPILRSLDLTQDYVSIIEDNFRKFRREELLIIRKVLSLRRTKIDELISEIDFKLNLK